MISNLIHGDCVDFLKKESFEFDLTFLDPPFNQGKEYDGHNDNMEDEKYWIWMKEICSLIFQNTSDGGSIYFMQREKNIQQVMQCLLLSGWVFQNMIIWKKKTSAVPQSKRFGKQYQLIVFATKSKIPKTFNKLRIDLPLAINEKVPRANGVYVTDVWDDIRELTSGYFAGNEPLKDEDGQRLHKQQSPIQLLTRIILSSSKVDDLVFDPFAGTATTLVVAKQLKRNCIGVELSKKNIFHSEKRLNLLKKEDDILKLRNYYSFTENLDVIWKI